MPTTETCQICGKTAIGEGYVESARVPLCPTCVQYSERFSPYQQFQPNVASPRPRLKDDDHFIENTGAAIKAAREAKGWDRVQLGKRLFISETDIRAFEEDRRKPSPAQVERLEKELHIKLLVKDAAEEKDKKDAARPSSAPQGVHRGAPKKAEEFTLGDIVTIKKK